VLLNVGVQLPNALDDATFHCLAGFLVGTKETVEPAGYFSRSQKA